MTTKGFKSPPTVCLHLLLETRYIFLPGPPPRALLDVLVGGEDVLSQRVVGVLHGWGSGRCRGGDAHERKGPHCMIRLDGIFVVTMSATIAGSDRIKVMSTSLEDAVLALRRAIDLANVTASTLQLRRGESCNVFPFVQMYVLHYCATTSTREGRPPSYRQKNPQ